MQPNQTYPAELILRRKPLVVGHWVGSKVLHAMTMGATYCGSESDHLWVWVADFKSADQLTCKKCLAHPWFTARAAK